MKRILCLLGTLMVILTVMCPVFAAADTFVPSIGYKDGPEIEDTDLNGENVDDCVIVSSIKDAEEKSTDISQEDRDLLLDVYQKLSDGSMKLPLDWEDYVIRELVDVSFKQTDCVEAGHSHKEQLAQDGTTITIQFDLGVKKSTEVAVLAYVGGEWKPVESVKNNGDGSVTCVFEDICPVAFCVDADAEPPKTGDAAGANLLLWIVLMAVSLAAIVILLVSRRRSAR